MSFGRTTIEVTVALSIWKALDEGSEFDSALTGLPTKGAYATSRPPAPKYSVASGNDRDLLVPAFTSAWLNLVSQNVALGQSKALNAKIPRSRLHGLIRFIQM